jgi:RNA polymerase-binding transcription factor DksA
MLDKKKIKEKLEKERDELIEQMKDMGKLNTETGEWEAIPEEMDFPESDQNDMADRFEEFESRSSMIKVLEPRLKNILQAIKGINRDSFGKCEICKKDIEVSRMEANPAARTCKKHLESEVKS